MLGQDFSPTTSILDTTSSLIEEVQSATETAQQRQTTQSEVEEARTYRDNLRAAKSNLQSAIQGNRQLLRDFGFSDLVDQVDNILGRIDEEVSRAQSFVDEHRGTEEASGTSGKTGTLTYWVTWNHADRHQAGETFTIRVGNTGISVDVPIGQDAITIENVPVGTHSVHYEHPSDWSTDHKQGTTEIVSGERTNENVEVWLA